jgi:hypothetical protein
LLGSGRQTVPDCCPIKLQMTEWKGANHVGFAFNWVYTSGAVEGAHLLAWVAVFATSNRPPLPVIAIYIYIYIYIYVQLAVIVE